jgi:hypothetical protein
VFEVRNLSLAFLTSILYVAFSPTQNAAIDVLCSPGNGVWHGHGMCSSVLQDEPWNRVQTWEPLVPSAHAAKTSYSNITKRKIELGSVPPLEGERRGSTNFAREAVKWSSYRLGDILKYWLTSFKEWKGSGPLKVIDGQTRNPFVCRTWPDSLGCRFLNSASLRVQNEDFRERLRSMNSTQRETVFDEIVGDILRERVGDISSQNTVVVHVRLSDVLIRDNCWELPPCMSGKTPRFYAYPLIWYDTVVQDIRKAFRLGPAPEITVVGFAHHATRKKAKVLARRSYAYRAKMVEYFKQQGFSASARPDSLPDDDFLYMVQAKFFVPGGGGFSRLIARFSESLGGRIFRVHPPAADQHHG